MTRKDFELIAEALRLAHDYRPAGSPEATLALVGDIFADKLAGTNPNFDRERFLKACKGGN